MRDVVHGNPTRNIFLLSTLLGSLLICGCNPSKSSDSSEENAVGSTCTEPENPYDEGTGHHAGYEWSEKNDPGTCGGSSQSFVEGCEEYQHQEAEYQECEAKKKR